MNQTSLRLSACAVALGLLACEAQAQSSVTLYGAVGLDLISASKVFNGGSTKSMFKLDDNAIVNSRIGLKGTEDLGGGLSAVFNLESSIAPDTGKVNSRFWNRGAYVGLSSANYGSLKLGHQWDAADDLMGNYFVFGYYSPFLLSGFGGLSDYFDNAVKYSSPNWGGFQFVAFSTLGEGSGKEFTQAAATYTAGPFSIGISADHQRAPGEAANDMVAVGTSYDFGPAKLRLGFARAKVEIGAPFKANLIDLGVDVPLSAMAGLTADFIKKDVKASSDDFQYLRLQAYYKLSKRTTLNSNLIFSKNSGNSNFAFITDGRDFAGQPGQKQTILTAGITHAF